MNTIAAMLAKLTADQDAAPSSKGSALEALIGLGHRPTAQRHHKAAHRSFTKASCGESKARRKMAAKSRKINRKK